MNGSVAVMPPGVGGRVLDFKRRGTPPRRKRRSLLAIFLKPLLTATFVVALPAGLIAWVLTAPMFRLRAIDVKPAAGPARRVGEGWVRGTLAPLRGKNLVRLSLGDATARLRRNPWVASVEIQKELPDRLHVKVAERRPEALLLLGETLAYADRDGRAIAPLGSPAELDDARKAGLLVVSFGRGPHPDGVAAALRVAAELGRVQPDWAAKLSRIEVLGEGDFRLSTDALPFPLLVTAGQVRPKVERLLALLPDIRQRYARIDAVDLRFSRRIVVQPAPPLPQAGGTGGLKDLRSTS